MDVTFEVLEGTPVSHPAYDVGVIFKFYYAPFYYIRVVTSKNSKLPRMHRQAYIKFSCKFTDWFEMCFTILDHIRTFPKIAPSRLSVYRKYVTSKPDHSQFIW